MQRSQRSHFLQKAMETSIFFGNLSARCKAMTCLPSKSQRVQEQELQAAHAPFFTSARHYHNLSIFQLLSAWAVGWSVRQLASSLPHASGELRPGPGTVGCCSERMLNKSKLPALADRGCQKLAEWLVIFPDLPFRSGWKGLAEVAGVTRCMSISKRQAK